MSKKGENILIPVGRMVQGSLYERQTTDREGRPLIAKSGKDAGKPQSKIYFASAVAKGTEKHWSETAWGKKIWAIGHADFPRGQASAPGFAWKVVDGDSTHPDQDGNVWADKDGFPGCWVLKFGTTWTVGLYADGGIRKLVEKDFVNPGDYIEVYASVSGNDSQIKPGVFLNPVHVCFIGYGERISLAIPPTSVGFGKSPLPPGASITPKSSGFVPPTEMPPLPPVTPHTDILNPPPPPSVPAAPMSPVYNMTAAADGISYEDYRKAGWTDEQLLQHGKMIS